MTASLAGDGVANPANVRALHDAAAMFGIGYQAWDARRPLDGPLIAVENTPDATSVYTATLPPGLPSIVVGNERRGIRPDVLRAARLRVHIPMPGRGVNTLNVASAAAVALYYLLDARGRRRPRPGSHRPEVLLLSPGDHVEAGSALRSAAAFGWHTVGVDDREKVWFGTPRGMRTEGRAAARSHRNPLRVVPAGAATGFTRVVVAGADGPPLHRTDLADGPGTLLVIPDLFTVAGQDWEQLGPAVEFARVPPSDRYRLTASIVLAEAARQVGSRTPGRPARGGPRYRSALDLVPPGEVDLLTPAELISY